MIFVSRYNDVRAYTTWRSKKEGRVYRLPTSSEFEYAARAGQSNTRFPWGGEPPMGRANFSTAGGERDISIWRERLQPVKRFAANAWGLHDMAGNVLEGVAPPVEGNGRVLVSADLCGDFRDEVVTSEMIDSKPVVRIYTNTAPMSRREVTRLADREYRMWLARNLGAGYGQYFEWQPK